MEAVQKALTPQNQQKLRSFLGLAHYYGKFIPSLETILNALNELLPNGKRWKCTSDCESVFNIAKEKLSRTPVLAHYDPSLPLSLAGDASA